MQVNKLLANDQFLSHWEWVQTEVRALKVLLPVFTINTFDSVTNVHPPVEARVVATSKSTVTAVAVAVIPVFPAGGVFGATFVGSMLSVEQLVKNPIPNIDITAKDPDFLRNFLLSSDSDPVLIFFMICILPNTVYVRQLDVES